MSHCEAALCDAKCCRGVRGPLFLQFWVFWVERTHSSKRAERCWELDPLFYPFFFFKYASESAPCFSPYCISIWSDSRWCIEKIKRRISRVLTFEFFPPLRADCTEYVLWTTCSGVEGDLSEEWSEPFSTMFSPSWLCGVGERERLRRTGEQAGVLLFELLAVLKKPKKQTKKKERKRREFIPMWFTLTTNIKTNCSAWQRWPTGQCGQQHSTYTVCSALHHLRLNRLEAPCANLANNGQANTGTQKQTTTTKAAMTKRNGVSYIHIVIKKSLEKISNLNDPHCDISLFLFCMQSQTLTVHKVPIC